MRHTSDYQSLKIAIQHIKQVCNVYIPRPFYVYKQPKDEKGLLTDYTFFAIINLIPKVHDNALECIHSTHDIKDKRYQSHKECNLVINSVYCTEEFGQLYINTIHRN